MDLFLKIENNSVYYSFKSYVKNIYSGIYPENTFIFYNIRSYPMELIKCFNKLHPNAKSKEVDINNELNFKTEWAFYSENGDRAWVTISNYELYSTKEIAYYNNAKNYSKIENISITEYICNYKRYKSYEEMILDKIL